MRRAFAVSLLALLVALPLFLCGCPNSDIPIDESRPDYKVGYQSGYDQGYQQGQVDRQSGLERDDTPPVTQGHTTKDYRAGFSKGYLNGYDRGYIADRDKGIDTTDSEYVRGYEDGFNDGASRGYFDCLDGKEQDPGGYQYQDFYNKHYKAGYTETFDIGYANGYNYAKASPDAEEMPVDWYAWYKGEDTRLLSDIEDGQTADSFEGLGGWYRCRASFDPHYIYELYINEAQNHYTLEMYPEGGFVIVFYEEGTCQIDEVVSTITGTPDELDKDRPDELPEVLVFDIECKKTNGSITFRLVDNRGETWE
ncbi:MAG: hypothetical protein SWK76_07465 [Actinomycetota bacterium]|nr:hypothetical protein [Actinomycetota bacterium]